MPSAFFIEAVAQVVFSTPRATSRTLRFAVALSYLVAGSEAAVAQGWVKSDLPDAPRAKPEAKGPQQQTQRGTLTSTVGLLSRRSLFFPELAHRKGPLRAGEKLALAADESIAPSRFLSSAASAAISQARDSNPGFGQGWDAYGKRFGSSMATTASGNLFATFLLASAFHQDPRYFVEPEASFKRRIGHALKREFVTPTDNGGSAFNVSGILGTLMAEGLANSYLPEQERTTGKTFKRFGIDIGVRAATNIVKEYWPDIFKGLGMRKLAPSDPGQNSGTRFPSQ